MSLDNLAALKKAARLAQAINYNRGLAYDPNPKQMEFHANGANYRERLLLAGNQLGKTWSAGREVAYHCTGNYPDWWTGRRFDSPVRCWVAGTSAEGTRDTVQRILLGDGLEYGTGSIPKSAIKEVKSARGITGAVSQIYVQHKNGGVSYIGFRTYEQPIDRWAGESLHVLWMDEEPPAKHYTEGLTRLNARQGTLMMTMTPLLGMTKTVQMFYPLPTTEDRALTMMTIDDVTHYTEKQRRQIIAAYPEHEREARISGRPMLGEGKVFPIDRSEIVCDAFPIPEHWPVLGGIDFGWDHPTGCVSVAWDRDGDCIYVTHNYKERKRDPDQISTEIKEWNRGQRWVWPHDGNVEIDRGSGLTIAQQYRRHGIRMIGKHVTFPDGGHGTEAGLLEMIQRMRSGRFKVFKHLEPWLAEFDIYHRKDGKLVKELDDLISATRLCVMGIRYANVREDTASNAVLAPMDNFDPMEQAGAM